MDSEDSFENDSDFLSSNVADFPSLLIAKRVYLTVTDVEKKENELIVKGIPLLGAQKREVRLSLRDLWSDTAVRKGYRVKVFDPQGASTSFVDDVPDPVLYVDSKKGLVVVEPTVLVSATTVSQSFYCQRKAVLMERFRGRNTSNMSMLLGNGVHLLFQAALLEENAVIDERWLRAEFEKSVLPSLSLQMIGIQMTPQALEREMEPYLSIIVQWIETYVRPADGEVATFHEGHKVTEIVDIEESNRMDELGIKGKIDVSLKVRDTQTGKHFVAPLELKTGKSKASFDHQGQVLLYSMMLSMTKNAGSIEPGYLLYLKDGTFRSVEPKALDLKGITKCRNQIAAILAKIETYVYPDPLSSSRFCDKCPASTVCTLLQRTTENSQPRSKEMENFVTTLTTHLSAKHLEYFTRLTRWVMMEWTAAGERERESFTYALNLSNVVQLMENSERSNSLRRLIIDMEPPQRRIVSRKDYDGILPIIKDLNKSQGRAILKAIFAKDYLCIEGFPGSGKTTTICALVQCLEKLGRSILITAYTNSAVDNIVLKLQKAIPSDKILRVGSSSVHRDVQSFTLEEKLRDIPDPHDKFKAMKTILSETPIVATTCLMAGSHNLFSWRKFNVCVVDEASLVTESTVVAPLLLADTFVMVGDKRQLCPLVIDVIAREEGMSVSLFERLCENKRFVVSLNEQYRMNEAISGICSTLFYNNAMVCGSNAVAKQTLMIPNQENDDLSSQQCGLARCFSSNIRDSVVMIDTKSYENPKYCQQVGSATREVFNTGEAECIASLCTGLVTRGISPTDIGVMTTYRHQVQHIELLLEDSRIEVNTVDQYQGREKLVMLLSMVHTDPAKRCELLHDERRLNVALSRARCKLIIVGCLTTLQEYKVFKDIRMAVACFVDVTTL